MSENTTIYAYNEDILGNKGSSTYTLDNIVCAPKYTLIEEDAYYLIRLNYPDNSENREYKLMNDSEWKPYDSKGVLLIKKQYKEQIESTDGIKINYNGKNLIFTDHCYYIDGDLSAKIF